VQPPKPPILLSPANGAVIPQNVQQPGCAPDPNRGAGFVIHFDWTDAQGGPGVAGYEIFVKRDGSSLPAVSTFVTASRFEHASCNGFVIDRNLEGWEWQVRTRDTAGNVSEWSPVHRFRFAPCRLASGVVCSAPPRPTPTSENTPAPTSTAAPTATVVMQPPLLLSHAGITLTRASKS
jgi:hypothetical protein